VLKGLKYVINLIYNANTTEKYNGFKINVGMHKIPSINIYLKENDLKSSLR
jgi:hypothetical protein